jgi:hypothetical protein
MMVIGTPIFLYQPQEERTKLFLKQVFLRPPGLFRWPGRNGENQK